MRCEYAAREIVLYRHRNARGAEVADILGKHLGQSSILYDKYHEAEFARRDLGIYLPELYHKQSELVVVVVGTNYDEKEWTGLEWAAIHDLLKQRKHDEVMTLAVRAAYDCSPEQFDRIVFLPVKDRELDDDGERQLGSFILQILSQCES